MPHHASAPWGPHHADTAVQLASHVPATTGGGGKDIGKAFRKVDENGDGVMSVAEFIKAIGPLAHALTPVELQDLIDQFDKDASGTVDFKEFLSLLGSSG